MDNQQVRTALVKRGYSKYNSETTCRIMGCEWSTYRKWDGREVPDCLTNDKQPQLGILYHSFTNPHSGDVHESYAIEICNENDLGWAKLKFYGLSGEQLLEKLDDYENALIRMWEVSWNEKTNISQSDGNP